MRSRLTACKLLLFAPALFLMLQVSLARHHHHTNSYHDELDNFHNVPISVDKQVCTFDVILGTQGGYPLYHPLSADAAHRIQRPPETAGFTTPSHSRAPPSAYV